MGSNPGIAHKKSLGFSKPLQKQTFTTAAVHPAAMARVAERKCKLTCSVPLWLQISKAQIWKSGAISDDQQGMRISLRPRLKTITFTFTFTFDICPGNWMTPEKVVFNFSLESNFARKRTFAISVLVEADWQFKMAPSNEFYLRYYVGHKGKFGHEFLEFEFRPDGKITIHIHVIYLLC